MVLKKSIQNSSGTSSLNNCLVSSCIFQISCLSWSYNLTWSSFFASNTVCTSAGYLLTDSHTAFQSSSFRPLSFFMVSKSTIAFFSVYSFRIPKPIASTILIFFPSFVIFTKDFSILTLHVQYVTHKSFVPLYRMSVSMCKAYIFNILHMLYIIILLYSPCNF